MDLIKEALSMGFANAAIMDTKDLVFVPEYRQFCEDNLCGNYNLVPACPPACGTVEEMHEKALKYEKALVLQTILKDPVMDPVLFKQAKHAQNILTEQLAKWMQENGKEDVLIMSAGPYKNCSCMSAYSVDAQKMADAQMYDSLHKFCFTKIRSEADIRNPLCCLLDLVKYGYTVSEFNSDIAQPYFYYFFIILFYSSS